MSPKRPRMTDKRWTIKDKIRQYKGLVRCSERDVKLLRTDRLIAERNQTKELQNVKKEIAAHRKELYNAINGSQQQLRNTLGRNPDLQRTFQRFLPEHTFEYIEHKNFNKRKLLDRLEYKRKHKFEELIEQKLRCGDLTNNSLVVITKTNVERKGEIVSGKLQEAIIKLDAAIQINQTYKRIIDVMKKDQQNFSSVLNQLLEDGCNQSKCMYRATQLGQLATEYSDDRKNEFDKLKVAVARDMKTRMLQIQAAQEQLQTTQESLKLLVQKENPKEADNTDNEINEDKQLHEDLQKLEALLNHLQNVTATTKFEDILPCIQNRNDEGKRMADILQKTVNKKEALLNKIEDAKATYSELINSTGSSTFEYMQNKVVIRQDIIERQTKNEELKHTLANKLLIERNIRSILLHLQQLCRIVITPDELEEGDKLSKVTAQLPSGLIFMPPQPEMDVFVLMSDLTKRLSILMEASDDSLDIQPDTATQISFQKMISRISRKVGEEKPTLNNELTLDVELRDPKIPTHETIKQESQQIVIQNAKPQWML